MVTVTYSDQTANRPMVEEFKEGHMTNIFSSMASAIYRSREFNSRFTNLFKIRRQLLCAVLAIFVSPPVFAQAIYGSISGTVTDSTGAAVAGARVIATDMDKNITEAAVTNSSGNYLIQHLIPDSYKVRISANGFSSVASDTLQVLVDSSARFDAVLHVGSSSTTIQVTEEAPQLKTDRADVSTTLDSRYIENLPNITRNATSFVLLAPGTTASQFSNSVSENPQQSTPVAANGQSPFSSGFILDGADNKDGFIGEIIVNPPLDSIAEQKFINQDYDAEFGAAVAGLTVMQTRSGGNSFHGSAFWYRHSDAQQARNPFTQYPGNNTLGPDIPPSLYNLFGGSVGGPIVKNRVFFFGDYQGVRSKTGNSFFQTVPTALVHQTCTGTTGYCDLSEYYQGGQGQVYDPATGDQTNGNNRTAFPLVNGKPNQIPNSRLSPAAVNLIGILPMPNNSNGIANNLTASGNGIFNTNQFDTRIDAQLKPTLHIFGRYGYLGSSISAPGALGAAGGQGFGQATFAGNSSGRNQNLVAGADYAFSSTLLTDARFGYIRYHILEGKYDGDEDLQTTLGMPGLNTGAVGSGGAAAFFVDGLSNIGSSNHGVNHCNCPLDETEQEYEIVNNWTKVLGNHSVKFGADLRRLQQLRVPSDTNRSGELSFSHQLTGSPSAGGGLGLATLLFGNVSGFSRYVSSVTGAEEHQPRIFLYAQDSWRVTPKLTLNYGLRWEDYVPESVNGKGKGGFYDLNTNLIRVAGYGNIGNNLNIENTYTYFAPRLGIAYQINPKLVVRAGYAKAFDPGFFGDIFGQLLTQTIPVLEDQGLTALSGYTPVLNNYPDPASAYALTIGPVPPTFYQVPANGLLPLPPNIYPTSRPDKMRIPYVDGWNLSLQQQMTSDTSFTLAYVGNKGTHTIPNSTWGGINWNDYTVVGYAQGVSQCARSVFFKQNGYCGPGYIGYYANEANSEYESLQAVVDKRYKNGLQFQASYVWSSALGSANGGYFMIDPSVNRGHFDYNRTNSFILYGIYDLPFGRGQRFASDAPGWVNAIIGGLQFNGALNWASGLPYSVGLSNCSAEIDNGPCRPNKVGGFSPHAGSLNPTTHLVRFFTPVQTPNDAGLVTPGQTAIPWQAPHVEQFGNVGANSVFGPHYFNSDLSLMKNFNLYEGIRMQLQVQAQNAFNHVNLGNPNSCVDCSLASGAGTINGLLGTATMRQLQFVVRFTF